MRPRAALALAALAALVGRGTVGLDNGVARVPPLGWASWNTYGTRVNESHIMRQADAMVALGLQRLGYRYIELDEPGFLRAPNGSLTTNTTRFPRGIKAVADYVHAKGLLFGIYSCAGKTTCAGSAPVGSPTHGWAGMYGHECADAAQFAAWGADYLFEDFCGAPKPGRELYPITSKCLNATGRPIFFLMCIWGLEDVATWGGSVANAWRIAADMQGRWDSVMRTWDLFKPWANYSGAGSWSFLDFLRMDEEYGCEAVEGEPNVTTMCYHEQQAHLSLWVISGSPLILGFDLTRTLANGNHSVAGRLLLNPEVLAVSQDSLAAPVMLCGSSSQPSGITWTEQWAKRLADGSVAIALFNRGDWSGAGPGATVPLDFNSIPGSSSLAHCCWNREAQPCNSSADCDPGGEGCVADGTLTKDYGKVHCINNGNAGAAAAYEVRDLWAREDLGRFEAPSMEAVVPDHGVRLFKVRRVTESA